MNGGRSCCTRVQALVLTSSLLTGAALSRGTQEFLNTTLVTMLQGYGCTETCGMTAILVPGFYQVSMARVSRRSET